MRFRTFLYIVCALLAAASLTSTANAQGQTDTVQIPYAPPTGEKLEYEITRTSQGPWMPPPATLHQQLSFEQVGDQYWLTIETTSLETAAGIYQSGDLALNAGNPGGIFALAAPITVSTTGSGDIVRVENWTDYGYALRSELNRQIDELPAGAMADQARLVINAAIDQNLAIPPESAALMLADPWVSFMGYGSTSFLNGSPFESVQFYPLFGGEVTVKAHSLTTASLLPDDAVQLVVTQRTSTNDFIEALEEMQKTIDSEVLDSLEPQRREEQQMMMEYDRISEIQVIFEPDGTIRIANWQVRFENAEGDIFSFNRVDVQRLPVDPVN